MKMHYLVNVRSMFKLAKYLNNCAKIERSLSTAAAAAATTTGTASCPFQAAIGLNAPTKMAKVSNLSKQIGMPYEQIPTPSGIPIIGTLIDLFKAGGFGRLHLYCDRRHQVLGPIYKENLGTVEAVFVSDAKLIQKVFQNEGKYPKHLVPEPWIIYNQNKGIQRGLFFMDGKDWSIRRRTMNKVFLMPQVFSEYGSSFDDIVSDMLINWDNKLEQNIQNNNKSELLVNDLEKQLYNLSIEAIGSMMFGRRMGCISRGGDQTQHVDVQEFVKCVQQIFVQTCDMQLIPPKLAYALRLPIWKRFEYAVDRSLELAAKFVEENARCTANGDSTNQGILTKLINDGEIPIDEIGDIIVDLFIAAADTTSHSAQWTIYLLAKNPHIQENIYRELEKTTQGEPFRDRHLQNMPYMKGAIKEAMRLYPVAPFITRYLKEDLNLAGYNIPKGKLVVVPTYTTGRKEEYFDEPSQFKPERWVRDKRTGKNQVTDGHATLPFGTGVRSCIGRRIAEVEIQHFITKLIQNFKFELANDEEVDIKLRMITTPDKPIDLIMRRR